MPQKIVRVRPTRSALVELEIELPDLGLRLSDIEHPLVLKAQGVPAQVEVRAANRIQSLTDRAWYKVKTQEWRGAAGSVAGHVSESVTRLLTDLDQWWWLVAAGKRQSDSPQHDFYPLLAAKAYAKGKKTCRTDFMLPGQWDVDRLEAESATVARLVVQSMVRQAAAESLKSSVILGFDIGEANVRVRVSMLGDGQVYLAVGATGIADASFFSLLFSSFPGVATGDWLPEPEGNLNIPPASGEILWSTLMTPEAQTLLLASVDADELQRLAEEG